MKVKQTRKEKWALKRGSIELENMNHMFTNFKEHEYICTHQKEIKKEKGCKH